jgi:hypothetical protein
MDLLSLLNTNTYACSLCVSVKRHSVCKLNRYMCVPQEERKEERKEEQMM